MKPGRGPRLMAIFAFAPAIFTFVWLGAWSCAGSNNRLLGLKGCPENFVQIGESCLLRIPMGPSPWMEAEKFCKRDGNVVATPRTLQRALQDMPSIFRPAEKTHWSARGADVFIMNLGEQTGDGESDGNRLERVVGEKKYAASHAYRCEKLPRPRANDPVSGADNIDRCAGCMEDAETCSYVLNILSCLILLDR